MVLLLSIILIAFMGISLKLRRSKKRSRMSTQQDFLYYEYSQPQMYERPQVYERPKAYRQTCDQDKVYRDIEQSRQRYSEDIIPKIDTEDVYSRPTNGMTRPMEDVYSRPSNGRPTNGMPNGRPTNGMPNGRPINGRPTNGMPNGNVRTSNERFREMYSTE